MGNKSMLTNRFNRKLVDGRLVFVCKSNDNTNDNKTNSDYVTNPIKSVSVKLDDVYTYKKPHYYTPMKYNDTLKGKHYCKQFGNKFFEIPKTQWRISTIELEQFATLVRVTCNVLASLNGYVSIKDVRNYLLEHEFVILDSKLLSNVVKAFLVDRPHLKKRYTYNRVKHNDSEHGFECDVHYHNSWYDREKWSKIMAGCEL